MQFSYKVWYVRATFSKVANNKIVYLAIILPKNQSDILRKYVSLLTTGIKACQISYSVIEKQQFFHEKQGINVYPQPKLFLAFYAGCITHAKNNYKRQRMNSSAFYFAISTIDKAFAKIKQTMLIELFIYIVKVPGRFIP